MEAGHPAAVLLRQGGKTRSGLRTSSQVQLFVSRCGVRGLERWPEAWRGDLTERPGTRIKVLHPKPVAQFFFFLASQLKGLLPFPGLLSSIQMAEAGSPAVSIGHGLPITDALELTLVSLVYTTDAVVSIIGREGVSARPGLAGCEPDPGDKKGDWVELWRPERERGRKIKDDLVCWLPRQESLDVQL